MTSESGFDSLFILNVCQDGRVQFPDGTGTAGIGT